MKAFEIFEKDQVLTLKVAQSLMGKRIAITSPEYRMNKPSVRIFTIGEIISSWEHAARTPYPEAGFQTFQEYWNSYMTKAQINDQINKLLLLDKNGERQAAAFVGSSFYPETTFTGSDEDREVYYVELTDEN